MKYFELYKYSPTWDKFVISCGILFSIAAGALAPTFAIVLGKLVEIYNPDNTKEQSREILLDFLPVIIVLIIATFLCAYLGFALMQISAERLSFKLRARYLAALMK